MIVSVISTVSAAGFSFWLLCRFPDVSDEMLRTAAGAYASVAVTMLGFMLALLAILVSVADKRLIRNMTKTGHFARLLTRIYVGAGYYGTTMLASLAALFLSGFWLHIVGAAASGLMTGATVALIVVGRQMWIVQKHLHPPSSAPLE